MALTAEQFADFLENPRVIENLKKALNIEEIIKKEVQKEVNELSKGFELMLEEQRKAHSKEVNDLREKLSSLEKGADEARQYSFREDLIVEGLQVPRSPEGNPKTTSDMAIKSVIDLGKSMGVHITKQDISTAHPMKQTVSFKTANKPAPLIVRFTVRQKRDELYHARKNLRGKNIFLSEHLTKTNSELFYNARQLKKAKEVDNCWTNKCKVYVLKNNRITEFTG